MLGRPAPPREDGGLSTPQLVGGARVLRCTTWNASALNACNLDISRRRIGAAKRMAVDSDALFLQECHGDTMLLEASLCDLEVSHRIWVSASPLPAAGGIITAVRRTLLNGVGDVRIEEVVSGRVMTVRLIYDSPLESLALINVHNYSVESSMRAAFGEHIRRLRSCMVEETSARPRCIAGGDWNFTNGHRRSDGLLGGRRDATLFPAVLGAP